MNVSDQPVPGDGLTIVGPELQARPEFVLVESLLLGSWPLGDQDPLTAVAYLVATTDTAQPTTWLAEVWFIGGGIGRRSYGLFKVEPENGRWEGNTEALGRALHERLFPVFGNRR